MPNRKYQIMPFIFSISRTVSAAEFSRIFRSREIKVGRRTVLKVADPPSAQHQARKKIMEGLGLDACTAATICIICGC
ncbi:MAG: hypothetical protein ACYTBX_05730 [Planctomycetota bacterium]|jgi:hypothetical protein